jgi:hypothetical protein
MSWVTGNQRWRTRALQHQSTDVVGKDFVEIFVPDQKPRYNFFFIVYRTG